MFHVAKKELMLVISMIAPPLHLAGSDLIHLGEYSFDKTVISVFCVIQDTVSQAGSLIWKHLFK